MLLFNTIVSNKLKLLTCSRINMSNMMNLINKQKSNSILSRILAACFDTDFSELSQIQKFALTASGIETHQSTKQKPLFDEAQYNDPDHQALQDSLIREENCSTPRHTLWWENCFHTDSQIEYKFKGISNLDDLRTCIDTLSTDRALRPLTGNARKGLSSSAIILS